MARVKLNAPEDVAEEHREFVQRVASGPMGLLNIFRAMSHSPEAMRRFMRLGTYLLGESKLDPRLREVAILRTGYVTRSPYEFSQHVAMGRTAGLSDDEIRAIAGDGVGLGEREQAVRRFADELTSQAKVSDDAFAAVRAFSDEQQVVEMAMLVGYYNLVARVLNALEVDLDDQAAKDLAAIGVKL